jgi:hypothetical protein
MYIIYCYTFHFDEQGGWRITCIRLSGLTGCSKYQLAAMRAPAIRRPCLSPGVCAIRGAELQLWGRIPVSHTSQPV